MDETRKNRDFLKGPVWDPEKNRWLVEIRYPDGSRLRKRFRREREALRVWSAEQRKIENGTWHEQAPKIVTFATALEQYRAYSKIQNRSHASYVEPALKMWARELDTSQLLARITAAQVEAVKLRRAEKVARSTADKDLGVLKAFLNWCMDRGLAATNPVCRVKFFHANNERVRYLKDEDWERLRAAALKQDDRSHLVDKMVLARHTGLRRANLFRAQWTWVDWLTRVLRVPRTKNNQAHALPLNDTAYATLKRLYAERDPELDSPYIFVHPRDAVEERMDFDPRDNDSRDEERLVADRGRGGNGDRDDYDLDADRRLPDVASRNLDDNDARSPGRGPGDSRESPSDERVRHARHKTRFQERQRDERSRATDPGEVFTRHLNLPRGLDRELVRDRDREYRLRGSESSTLATVGAFRVVSSRDLRDYNDRPIDPRSGDLRHLREQGLIETIRVPGYREQAVTLTKEGRSLLERHRDPDHSDRQTFYNGVKRERELEHDVQVYRAYERQAERLEERGARIDRVVLDYELKREYQQWLHERDRDRAGCDGHPDRTDEEIRQWALEHDLPYFDDEVHFPDLRVEYQEADGRWDHDDIEVVTEHYRGAHGASVVRSGFSCYRGSSGRIGGRSGGSGSPFDPGVAEEVL